VEMKDGLFRSRDSHLLSDIAAFGVGAGFAHGPGGDAAVIAASELGSGRPPQPHWVLVQADEDTLLMFASDKRGRKGRLLRKASRGTFRASLHRTIGQIQLTVFVHGQPSVALRGKAGFGRLKQVRVARAVVDLAKAS
jgi:hypothetical protein